MPTFRCLHAAFLLGSLTLAHTTPGRSSWECRLVWAPVDTSTSRLTWIVGNTIFLALSTAGLPANSDSLRWARSGLSILSLTLGSFLTSWVYAAAGPTRRLTLFVSFLVQTACIAVAAVLVQTDVIPESVVDSKLVLLAIPLLAAQSGAQIVTAKSLGFNEIPTTVVTSVYDDLGGDTELLAWDNPKRNRRVGAVAMILLGGISAAWLSRGGCSLVVVLWLGAAIKLLLSFSWLLFRADKAG